MVDEGHDVLVIEKKQDVLYYAMAENDIMGILGDGTDPDLLREAEVDKADFFIALASDDEVNIVAGNMAKILGTGFTIARARSPKYQRNDKFMKTFMGIDYFLNPEMLSAIEVELTLDYAMASPVEFSFRGKLEMIEFTVNENSRMIGESLSDLSQMGILDNLLITIVDKDSKIYI